MLGKVFVQFELNLKKKRDAKLTEILHMCTREKNIHIFIPQIFYHAL